jgi:hypothetical protein
MGWAETIRAWALEQRWLYFAHDSLRGLDGWVILFFVGSLAIFFASLLTSMILGGWSHRPYVQVSEPMMATPPVEDDNETVAREAEPEADQAATELAEAEPAAAEAAAPDAPAGTSTAT